MEPMKEFRDLHASIKAKKKKSTGKSGMTYTYKTMKQRDSIEGSPCILDAAI